MTKEKTAEFLADCLEHMPDQPEHLQRVVETVLCGLIHIANGQEWPENEAWAAAYAARTAARAAARAAAYWAAAWAARTAADEAWAADATYWADRVADYAARAHPDPDAERARQKARRKELGI